MSWVDVVIWFSHLYICWSTAPFAFQREVHDKWVCSPFMERSILADDAHLVVYNPQFHLRIHDNDNDNELDTQNGDDEDTFTVWLLLSRHVMERKRDLSQKYLAVHVHTGSERVYCPAPPVRQGVYSNGECTLVKLVIAKNGNKLRRTSSPDAFDTAAAAEPEAAVQQYNTGAQHQARGVEKPLSGRDFVLVVSQYSHREEFNFTMRVHSHVRTSITRLSPPFTDDWNSVYFKGEWTSSTAGGCSNDLWSYFRNPHLRFTLPTAATICCFLESPSEHSVNLRIFCGRVATARLLRTGKAISSGPYRSGCCVIQTKLPAGHYTILASTFKSNETGPFLLACHCHLSQKDAAVDHSSVVPPRRRNGTAGGGVPNGISSPPNGNNSLDRYSSSTAGTVPVA
eukprot:Lankesteria_metandrocarpae@DN9152_c0_g1_i1.p1